MERGRLWRTAFKTNQGLLERNLPGYTDEVAAKRPAPDASSPAWILAHLTHARRGLLSILGHPAPPDPALSREGRRGSDGGMVDLPFSELLFRFQATDARLKEAFMAEEDWDRPVNNPGLNVEQPLEQVVAFMHMHESYHIGQIGYCRKLLGLKGAV